tara:strand:- start:3437 stop:4075 length:639 start_codon:yes stop_codon:yes gene_type:complete
VEGKPDVYSVHMYFFAQRMRDKMKGSTVLETFNISSLISTKTTMLGLVVSFSITTVSLGGDQAAQNALACAKLAAADARHKCIDKIALSLSLKKEKRSILVSALPERAQRRESEPHLLKSFGADQLRQSPEVNKVKEVPKPRLMAEVVKVRKHANGIVSYFLKTGEVWKQTEGVYAGKLKVPFTAELKKGTLSGYRMRVAESNHFVRVRRIK